MSMIQIYGASGHASVVIEALMSADSSEFYIIDDDPNIKSILNFKVHQTHLAKPIQTILAIGNNYIRKRLSRDLNLKYTHATHKKAVISDFSSIGEGTVVLANAVINANSHIGKHVIINTSAVIEHDCVIGDYAHISPHATLCGNVEVSELSHIGAGAVINPGIKIGTNTIIGSGSTVIHNIPDNMVAVGNPAKVIKANPIKPQGT